MAWISAELFDVLLHPLHTLPLVFEAVVDTATFEHLLACKEAVRSHAVV